MAKLTRAELKQKRSEYGRKGAEARWSKYRETCPQPNYHEIPDPCFEITFTNHASGKITTMVFHPGSRRGRYRIDIDGTPWQECGWSEATAAIRKSGKHTPLYIT